MDEESLINLILSEVEIGRFDILPHARKRMKGRTVSFFDIQCAARTAHHKEVQDLAKGKILFEGIDEDEELLEIVAAYECGVVIISVFGD